MMVEDTASERHDIGREACTDRNPERGRFAVSTLLVGEWRKVRLRVGTVRQRTHFGETVLTRRHARSPRNMTGWHN